MLIDLIPSGISVNNLLSKLYASRGATMVVMDKSGLEREGSGIVRFDDKLVVTSESGEVTNAYFLSFALSFEKLYVVYVLSDEYMVDNVGYVIQEVTEGTTVSDMLGNLTPSPGASMMLTDASGNEKADGTVAEDDILVVTSGDGVFVVRYTLTLVAGVSTPSAEAGHITLYPNPTSGLLHISGLDAGQRIQVYSQVGAAIRDVQVHTVTETISLEDQPAGMYIIIISSDETIARYKAIKQ
jgi:hypothetical protein